jgi:hypothetical protein
VRAITPHRGMRMGESIETPATVAEAVAALETSLRPDLPPELLTPQTLAQSGASFGKLHEALTAAGVSIAAYSKQTRAVWEYVNTHPEQVDVVRLMGGTEHDLVSALMTEWLRDVTAERTGARQVADGGDAADDTSNHSANSPDVINLASHRARRKRQQRA